MPNPELSEGAAVNAMLDRLIAGLGLLAGVNTIGRVLIGGADPTVAGAIVTAPAAGAVIATTGALAAGSYRLEVAMGYSGVVAAGKHILLEHRTAADAATLFTLALCPAAGALSYITERIVIANTQVIRIIAGAVAGAAGEVAHGSIRAQLLPS